MTGIRYGLVFLVAGILTHSINSVADTCVALFEKPRPQGIFSFNDMTQIQIHEQAPLALRSALPLILPESLSSIRELPALKDQQVSLLLSSEGNAQIAVGIMKGIGPKYLTLEINRRLTRFARVSTKLFYVEGADFIVDMNRGPERYASHIDLDSLMWPTELAALDIPNKGIPIELSPRLNRWVVSNLKGQRVVFRYTPDLLYPTRTEFVTGIVSGAKSDKIQLRSKTQGGKTWPFQAQDHVISDSKTFGVNHLSDFVILTR